MHLTFGNKSWANILVRKTPVRTKPLKNIRHLATDMPIKFNGKVMKKELFP